MPEKKMVECWGSLIFLYSESYCQDWCDLYVKLHIARIARITSMKSIILDMWILFFKNNMFNVHVINWLMLTDCTLVNSVLHQNWWSNFSSMTVSRCCPHIMSKGIIVLSKYEMKIGSSVLMKYTSCSRVYKTVKVSQFIGFEEWNST